MCVNKKTKGGQKMLIPWYPKTVRCVKCRKKFKVGIGDVRPQIAECPYCKFKNIVAR